VKAFAEGMIRYTSSMDIIIYNVVPEVNIDDLDDLDDCFRLMLPRDDDDDDGNDDDDNDDN